MVDKLMKGALLFTAGAAVGAAAALWLMSEHGKPFRDDINNLAGQAKDKLRECCDKVKQQIHDNDGEAHE